MSNIYQKEDISYEKVTNPGQEETYFIELTDETMKERKNNVLKKMREFNFDCLLIYADLEHCNNFEYLTGFTPRFEEALLVLHRDGKAFGLLGNETMKMEKYSRLPFKAILAPHFSLPNQPFEAEEDLSILLKKTRIKENNQVGMVGWKLFSEKITNARQASDFPGFILESVQKIVPANNLRNATNLFIHPAHGLRTINNENEIAHYSYGQTLASNGILRTMEQIAVGKSERELASYLEAEGQRNTVVTICSTGERFKNANLYPGNQKVKLGDRFSMTVGYKGGLASRSGYVVYDESELKNMKKDYLADVVKPYFSAVATWLKGIKIGMTGGDLYDLIDSTLPRASYGWSLNPGHLVADEEWLSSPIYKNSTVSIKSGMIFQIDIIPSIAGYDGVSAESGVALADEQLQMKLAKEYPKLWQQIERRRHFIINEIGIDLSKEVLPLSNTVGYLVPLLLRKEYGLKINKDSRNI